MKFRILAAVAIAMFSTSALAADPPELDIIEDDPVFDWSGFYVGVHAGGGWGAVDWDATAPAVDISVPVSGWLAGATLGVNHQVDNFVLGIEGDVSWSNIGGSILCPNGINMCDSSIGWLGTLRGRAGYAVDQALLYVTAGVAAGSVHAGYSPDFPGLVEHTGVHLGWVVGAGVELAVTENVSIKGEYNFVRLTGTAPAGALDANPVGLTSTIHIVKVGANWHF